MQTKQARVYAIWAQIKKILVKAKKDRIVSLGAALAFYVTISLPALVYVLITVMSLFLRSEDVQRALLTQSDQLLGSGVKEILQNIMAEGAIVQHHWWRLLLGAVLLVVTVTRVFGQAQSALNQILGIVQPTLGWKEFVYNKIIGLAALVFVGLVLAFYSIASTILAHFDLIFSVLRASTVVCMFVINAGFGLLMVSFLFAVLLAFLPSVRVPFWPAWRGAWITAVLFVIGQNILALYFRFVQVGSSFGVTGSLIVILLWIYYSAQILFLGAEITYASVQPVNPLPAKD